MKTKDKKKYIKKFKLIISQATSDFENENFSTLNDYIIDYNNIIQLFHKDGLYKEFNLFQYEPDNDEQYYGGISDEGKAKFKKIINNGERIISDNKFSWIQLNIGLILNNGIVLFLIGIAFTAGMEIRERKNDFEKNSLKEQNAILKQKLDSCSIFKDPINVNTSVNISSSKKKSKNTNIEKVPLKYMNRMNLKISKAFIDSLTGVSFAIEKFDSVSIHVNLDYPGKRDSYNIGNMSVHEGKIKSIKVGDNWEYPYKEKKYKMTFLGLNREMKTYEIVVLEI